MNNIIITIKYNIMSAAEGCKIAFKVNYTSSSAIKTAIAYYKISGTQSEIPHDIKEMLVSNQLIQLPIIEARGTYDLRVLVNNIDNASDQAKSSFKIGMCASCEKPYISDVLVEDDGQIVLLYKLDDYSNLVTVEYQIAKDSDFQNVIYSKKGLNTLA
jgi:hypothetical protein